MKRLQTDREEFLSRLFATYKNLLGDFEPTPAFIPMVWRRIEARRNERDSWANYLVAWSPRLAFTSVAAALLLIASLWLPSESDREAALINTTYVDVLTASSMDEQDGALWALAANRR
ncbi:MAG: hypothetical protein OXC19_13105 [Bryobacterales bacterium]|nr:hypothetical protein [Bryobacterales bacterium]